jgi:hypothetical protein
MELPAQLLLENVVSLKMELEEKLDLLGKYLNSDLDIL